MNEKKTKIHPRKLARQIARASLDREGVTGYNKEGFDLKGRRTPSLFARKWRELCINSRITAYSRRKGARK